jgi:hypothetical protein
LFYVFIVGLLIALVALERNLDAEPRPQVQLVRRLSRQWLDGDADIDPRPVQVWLSRSHTRDAARLSRKLRLSHEETVNLLILRAIRTVKSDSAAARRGNSAAT